MAGLTGLSGTGMGGRGRQSRAGKPSSVPVCVSGFWQHIKEVATAVAVMNRLLPMARPYSVRKRGAPPELPWVRGDSLNLSVYYRAATLKSRGPSHSGTAPVKRMAVPFGANISAFGL